MKNIALNMGFIMVLFLTSSCDKFLSKRPSASVTNPTTLEDLQALMDNINSVNQGVFAIIGEGATDDFFLGPGGFDRLSDFDKSLYLWGPEPIYQTVNENIAWALPYHLILISNTVLEEIPLVRDSKVLPRNTVEGTALFHRAFTYLSLAQTFCKAYDHNSATNDLGVPLRLESDLNLPSIRSSLRETYNSILNDASKAADLLPLTTDYKTRPNKAAAFALLARTYLTMENYDEALKYADMALQIYGTDPINYNRIDGSKSFPFTRMNDETIFYAYGNGSFAINPSRECYVDTVLYKSYDDLDLRKSLFFRSENNGYHTFRGSYLGTGSSTCFNGLTVSEMLLIIAECQARKGNINAALNSLNHLLKNRYQEEYFIPRSETNVDLLLGIVLTERRKEMLFRGQRWPDLKRLNRDPRFVKTLYRKVEGQELLYELPPNDLRYVMPIPQSVIDLTGMQQNHW